MQNIGNHIGTYIQSDTMNFNGAWKAYVRIRVKMSVIKPLKRRMRIKREGGEWSWINFKYERLGTFCFVCGVLGHSERDCSIVYANPGKKIERVYGAWLKAPGINSRNTTGSRWLRNGEGGSTWDGNGDKSWRPETGTGDARDEAGFQVPESFVSEIGGDNGRKTVIARNQGEGVTGGKNLNEMLRTEENTAETNFVIDPKRRRTATYTVLNDNGPAIMQTDVLEQTTQCHNNTDSKNLRMAGSGNQARLTL